MSKKIIGIIMACVLVLSLAVVGISSVSAAVESNKIAFDVKSSGWTGFKNVYCHIWSADGTGVWPSWQGKSEKCEYDSSTGIATYDLSKTGNTISPSDGKLYLVIFSTNTDMQTYTAVMSGSCMGDTLYCTGNELEHPEDSEKLVSEAVWIKNKDCGPAKRITTTGNVVGTALSEGSTNETLLAQYLVNYYDDAQKTACTQNLVNTLVVSPDDVRAEAVKILKSDLYFDKNTILEKIDQILAECIDPKEDLIYGDVNLDGVISVVDATLLQKYVVNLVQLKTKDLLVADVDDDGIISVKDATSVQKYIVHLDGYGKTGENLKRA